MSLLRIEKEDRVLHVTLNRPDKRNALSLELCNQLSKVMSEAQDDEGVGAILLDAAQHSEKIPGRARRASHPARGGATATGAMSRVVPNSPRERLPVRSA